MQRTKEEELSRLGDLAEAVGVDVFIKIGEAVCKARQLHPHWKQGYEYALRTIKSEMLEWEAQAILVQNADGVVDEERLAKAEVEALHAISVLIRYLSRDYVKESA